MATHGKTAVALRDGSLEIRAPYSAVNLERCRSIGGRRWNAESKTWFVPANVVTMVRIVELFGRNALDPDAGAHELLGEVDKLKARNAPPEDPEVPVIPNAKTTPWKHQARAWKFAKENSACLLAMGMGTGKSKVIVDLVGSDPSIRRVLILAPLSVVGVWPRQFAMHYGGGAGETLEVLALDDRFSVKEKFKELSDKIMALVAGEFFRLAVVVNYESAWRKPLADLLMRMRWDLVVCDESHKVKSHNGAASEFVSRSRSATKVTCLRQIAKRRICLTGTPMPHSPLDIFGQARFLSPQTYGESFPLFKARYAITGGFENKQVVGYQNQDEMARLMAPLTFEAKTDEVLDLPPAVHITRSVVLDPVERKAYREMERDLICGIRDGSVTAANAAVRVGKLAQITGGFIHDTEAQVTHRIGGSKDAALKEVLEEFGGEPAVVFSRFTENIASIHATAKELGIQSDELSGNRKDLDQGVWRGPGNVLATQIQAGGVGVDLTRARYCCFYSLGYSYGEYEQALARVRRPGQTRPVTYVHLIATGTVDEAIYEALQHKRDAVEYIIERMKS